MANRPVQSVAPADVAAGDVVLVRAPKRFTGEPGHLRWLLVDRVAHNGEWHGRWVFGETAGTTVAHLQRADRNITRKDPLDAALDKAMLEEGRTVRKGRRSVR